MSLVKNQHYVPQSYLRNFAEKNLAFISINGGNIFRKSVRRICSEEFLYDVENFDLYDKQIIENFYGKNIDAYFPEITNFCKDGKQQVLTPQMRELLVTCCLSLVFRHPKFINNNPEFNEEDIIVEKGNKQINYSKIKRVSSHLENFKRLVDLRINDGIAVSFCDLKTEFITNDNPVLITNSNLELQSHFDPSNMLYLPLSPQICITFTPSNDPDLKRTFIKSSMPKDQVYLINQRIEEQSERTLIGTENGLKNFFKEKEFYSDEKNKAEYLERVKVHSEIVIEVFRIAQLDGPYSKTLELFMDKKLELVPSLKENLSFMQILFKLKNRIV